jgi:3-isopropylmalate dehydrogenase
MKIAVLPGDGIGPEIMAEARKVLAALDLPDLTIWEGDVGAAGYRLHGHPLPLETVDRVLAVDAVLFGAVGDPRCDSLERHLRPEQAILGLRQTLGLFANLRPIKMLPGLNEMSALRPQVASAIDLLIIRELSGDVYFGEKAIRTLDDGRRQGSDLMSYAEDEVRRIARVAFNAARSRRGKLCSVDKANALETSQLWREVMIEVSSEYPEIELSHMYVDNAAMQLVRDPGQFDVIVTGNLFGDILSDQASMCVGSIGLLASASLGDTRSDFGFKGLYEPIHGSAPDIAGQGRANPMGMILSTAMMLRHSFGRNSDALRIEGAVAKALADGVKGADLPGGAARTAEIGDAIVKRL